MKSLGAGSHNRHFPRWEPNPVPQCPAHGDMVPTGRNWRCKLCPRVAAGQAEVQRTYYMERRHTPHYEEES